MPTRPLLLSPPPLPASFPAPRRSILIISAASSAFVLLFLFLFSLYLYFSLRRRRSPTLPFDLDSPSAPPLRRFRRRILQSSTSNFHPSRLLGHGASASVFLATLPDGSSVAVKSLSSASPIPLVEFKNELSVLSTIKLSPFVVALLGYSNDYRCLVFEYMPKGSLQTALFDSDSSGLCMSWEIRFRVILDVAMGLEFLHSECDPPIVHGDIKPSNVLLGFDFRAKIADFGLAKLKLDSGVDEFSQDLGLFPSQEYDFEFSKAVRVRCNPIASLEDTNSKEVTVAVPLCDESGAYSVENSKELNDGDWWWKQESCELDSKDYVGEWIGSQICNSSHLDCNDDTKMEKKSESRRRDERIVKEWWKEEYYEEMSKKSSSVKCSKRLKWFKSNNISHSMNNVGRKSKKRSKSMGSERDLFSKELSSTTSMRGTICYVAPEHNGCVQYMEKGDIYSFGVLILVTISGRRPLNILPSPLRLERSNLISWCKQLASSGDVLDLVDERLNDLYDREQVRLCINLALSCLQKSPELRPSSVEIVRILKGEMDAPCIPFEFSPSPNSKTFSKSKRKGISNGERVC